MKSLQVLFIALITALIVSSLTSCYQEANAKAPTEKIVTATGLNWTSIESLQSIDNTKYTLIDVYTDWCSWCKVMDQKTFNDEALGSYLSKKYNLVKFNAENKASLKFQGDEYEFINGGKRGYNQLAVKLLKGKLSYPAFVVLDENLETKGIIRGYKSPEQFKSSLEELDRISE